MTQVFECKVLDENNEKHKILLLSDDFNENINKTIATKLNRNEEDMSIDCINAMFRIILKKKDDNIEDDNIEDVEEIKDIATVCLPINQN